jgi:diaminobutyrate-2-oxoglutarate transaminase
VALKKYWSDDSFSKEVKAKAALVQARMEKLALRFPQYVREIRGHGMIWGAEFKDPDMTSKVCAQAFEDGLVIETAGAGDEVIKFLGPLVISEDLINEGFDILEGAVEKVGK